MLFYSFCTVQFSTHRIPVSTSTAKSWPCFHIYYRISLTCLPNAEFQTLRNSLSLCQITFKMKIFCLKFCIWAKPRSNGTGSATLPLYLCWKFPLSLLEPVHLLLPGFFTFLFFFLFFFFGLYSKDSFLLSNSWEGMERKLNVMSFSVRWAGKASSSSTVFEFCQRFYPQDVTQGDSICSDSSWNLVQLTFAPILM